jgi:sensor domain CHASE-containing protein
VGWTDSLSGSLVAGGKLTVDYDLARQPQCESSTYNGLPAWNTEAYVRFEPDGVTWSKSVRGAQDAQGRWSRELFTLDVPADATRVSMWFETSGVHCATSWDSNWGSNWSFPVGP